jgi:uncharacterized cupredoxin-like copper-binding protein
MTRSALAVAGVAALGLAAAGCGSSNNKQSSAPATTAAPATTQATQSTPTPAPKTSQAVTIAETEYKLTPAHPTAKAGSVNVVAKNAGAIVHTLEVEGHGVEKKTADIAAGGSATLKVNLKPGTYKIYCTISGHRKLGMDGTLVVS